MARLKTEIINKEKCDNIMNEIYNNRKFKKAQVSAFTGGGLCLFLWIGVIYEKSF